MHADAHASGRTSLGRALVVLGDRWNLLILERALRGATRFQDWKSALPLADPVLAARLRDLVADGLLFTRAYSQAPVRKDYFLTEAGADLWRVFVALAEWDTRWQRSTGTARAPRAVHAACGLAQAPVFACGCCGAAGIGPQDTVVRRENGGGLGMVNPQRRYRRSAAGENGRILDSIEVLGDRWSTSVLSASMLGARRYTDFQRMCAVIPPHTLSLRLALYVDQGVLRKSAIAPGGKREEYRLTAKGLDFFPVFAAIVAWANEWFAEGPVPITIHHQGCGAPLVPSFVCGACAGTLSAADVGYTNRKSVPQIVLDSPRRF